MLPKLENEGYIQRITVCRNLAKVVCNYCEAVKTYRNVICLQICRSARTISVNLTTVMSSTARDYSLVGLYNSCVTQLIIALLFKRCAGACRSTMKRVVFVIMHCFDLFVGARTALRHCVYRVRNGICDYFLTLKVGNISRCIVTSCCIMSHNYSNTAND